MPKELVFTCSDSGEVRADQSILRFLSEQLPELAVTRSQIKGWIADGAVLINQRPARKAGAIVKRGDQVKISLSDNPSAELQPYNFEVAVVFEDAQLLVLDKPAGISMHPGAGNRSETLLNALLARGCGSLNMAQFGQSERPGIVHRLDKDTSGLVVIAKNLASLNCLAKQFKQRTISRLYQALVLSTPRAKRLINQQQQGQISTMIGRDPIRRKQMAVLEQGGRQAVTNWRRLEQFSYGCLVELSLQTGRTHQIRVHLNWIGSPVIADPVYGDFSALPARLKLAANSFGRQALHATRLGFDHPISGERLEFCSALPPDFAALVEIFKSYAGV